MENRNIIRKNNFGQGKKVKSMHHLSHATNVFADSPISKHANRELTCGILGGLGPEATVNFLSLLIRKNIELYGAKTD